MKTAKIILTSILILTSMYITGCNNDMVSPMSAMETEINKSNSAEQDHILGNSKFNRLITIEPHQVYSFDYGNTGLRLFRSISITDCELISNQLEIYGYRDDERILLNCNSSNFNVSSIQIRNLTSNSINLNLTLSGSGIPVINNLELN